MSPNKDDYPQYRDYSEDRGFYCSIGLHVLLIGLAVFGIPFLPKKEVEPMKVVTVELVPISSLTNLPSSPQPAPAPKEEKKAPEPPKEEKKAPPPPPPPPPPTPEPPKPEVKEEKAPEEKAEQHPDVEKKKKEEPKKKEPVKDAPKPKVKPPEEKPKKKKDELDFDSVLKTVEKIEKKQAKDEKKAEEPKPKSEAKAKSEAFYDPSKQLSMSEQDAIRQQISQYWSIPAGAKDAQNLQVELHITLLQDGTVRNVELADQSRYNGGDTFYRAAADSAIRAVLKAKQIKGLPAEKYDEWKDITIVFDPKDMLY